MLWGGGIKLWWGTDGRFCIIWYWLTLLSIACILMVICSTIFFMSKKCYLYSSPCTLSWQTTAVKECQSSKKLAKSPYLKLHLLQNFCASLYRRESLCVNFIFFQSNPCRNISYLRLFAMCSIMREACLICVLQMASGCRFQLLLHR